MPYVILNGQLTQADKAFIPVQDRGFRFGDGLFETIRVEDAVPYRFDWHLRRLSQGLDALNIAFDTRKLPAQVKHLLHENKVGDALLRIQVTRGSGSRGYLPDPASATAPAVLIETLPLPALTAPMVALWRSEYIRMPARAIPTQYKLCQGLNSILARMEADAQRCFDALMLNEHGQLCETSSGNLFWISADRLYTPSLACGCIDGSARDAILRLSHLPSQETEATLDELRSADAVFITNAAMGVVAIGALHPTGLQWNSQPAAQEFSRLLEDNRKTYAKEHKTEWS